MSWVTDVLQRTAGVLIALILGAAGCLALASNAVAGTSPGHVHAHGYDAPVSVEPSTHTAPERGPPAASYTDTTPTSVDSLSSRVSARSDGAVICAYTAYALPAEVAQGRPPAGTAAMSVELIGGAGLSAHRWHVAAKSVDEAGALVRYDPMAASRNLLGQVGEGYARTPSGYTVSAHAAERIVYGAPGRSPTTLSRVDDILNNPTSTMMRPNGTVRVYQGKDWVAVRDTGPMHIVTVMVR